MAEPLLALKALGVRHGKTQAVDGVDLQVAPGEIVALVGANGAGKSSMLKAVLGVGGDVSGELHFDRLPLAGLAPHARVSAGIALVPEGRHVFPRLSVRENLELGFTRGTSDQLVPRIDRMFGLFPILASRAGQMAGTLSGGEQQMLVIGRALMSAPRLLMLDEPTLGLAPLIVKALGDLLAKLRSEGQTILLAEQNARMSLAVSDRAYVLAQGRVLREGASAALRDSDEIRKAYLGL